jgi:hypothetical protein
MCAPTRRGRTACSCTSSTTTPRRSTRISRHRTSAHSPLRPATMVVGRVLERWERVAP